VTYDQSDHVAPDPVPGLVRPYVVDPGLLGDDDLTYGDSPSGNGDPSALRPYLLTAGRVRPIDDSLEIEAQVATTTLGRASSAFLEYEHRDIVAMCVEPMSVAEVAARLELHVSVVRVLVGDLAALGHLTVLRPDAELAKDARTIERVIRGLEAIS
jgi:hypothetical protein